MADIDNQIKRDAESGHLDRVKNDLFHIPPDEHLAIIRSLKQAEQGNPNLDIDIQRGSTDTNYDYTITYHGGAGGGVQVPDNMVNVLAQAAGVSVEKEKQLLAQAGGSGDLTLHESLSGGQHILSADKKL